jgi:hypothetical protein
VCVSQNEPLLITIYQYCILTILMRDVCNMIKYLNLQLGGYKRYIRLENVCGSDECYLYFRICFLRMIKLRSHTLFYSFLCLNCSLGGSNPYI